MIKAIFITCSNAGVAHWRIDNFVQSAYRNKLGHFFAPWYDKSRAENHPWEMDIVDDNFKNRLRAELWDHCALKNEDGSVTMTDGVPATKPDVIVFQMVHTEPALRLFLSMKQLFRNTPVITESDDNILSTPDYNPASIAYNEPGSYCRNVAVAQFRASDAMIVSTPSLKEAYAEFCDHIYIVPNSLDFRIWDNVKQRRNKDLIRIGWAGGASHNDDLKIIEPVVHKTLEKHPTAQFTFVHGIPPFLRDIPRVETVAKFARIDRYPQFMASRNFDIGMAPLVDNAFNRAKSNLRWLEYAGLRVPCVASKVGHFEETIRHGEDGLLCHSEQDWLDSIDFLIHDESARRKMGKAANARARKDFNVDIVTADYCRILSEISDRGQVRPIDSYPVGATA